MLKKLLLVVTLGLFSTAFAEKNFVINTKRINKLIQDKYSMAVYELHGNVRYTLNGSNLSSDAIEQIITEKFLNIAESSSSTEEFLTQLAGPETTEDYSNILFHSYFSCDDSEGNTLERLIHLTNNYTEDATAIAETITSLYHEYMQYAQNRPTSPAREINSFVNLYEFCAVVEKTDQNTIIIKVNLDWKSVECIDFSVKREQYKNVKSVLDFL